MSETFEVWLGDCHLRAIGGDGDDAAEVRCQAAVWADGFDTFRMRLMDHITTKGYRLLWLEEVHSAPHYLARHGGQQHRIGGLARAVHPGHFVELGPMHTIGDPAAEAAPQEYLTITEHDIAPLPDQSALPFWDRDWIAPGLKDLLFGQPGDGAKLRTYFIVDAILRKKITGVFDLDRASMDVPIQCLFKGDAAEELKEAAPYLIDMTLPDGAWDDRDQVPAFHKDFFAKHWDHNTGIFIRTPALFADVWGHFRKFTRVQMEEDERWVYFRFWDPRITPSYFESVRQIPDRAIHWANLRNSSDIHSIIGNKTNNQVWCVKPNQGLFGEDIKVSRLTLSDVEIAGFIKYKRESFIEELLPYFKEKDAFHSAAIGDNGLRDVIRLGIERASLHGLTRKSPVKLYIHMMLYLGSYFDDDPLLPWVQDILKSDNFDEAQAEKANELRSGFIEYLEEISGKNGEHLQSFMKTCQAKLDEENSQISNNDAVSFIKSGYPQKFQHVGSDLMSRLVDHSEQFCRANDLSEGRSVLSLSCLRLVYGTRMLEDPLFPWMKKVFEADAAKTKKDELFHKVTKKFLSTVVQYVEGDQ